MFPNLKSALSNHVSPGASHVSVSPFAFLIGTRIEVCSSAGDDSDVIERVRLDLMEVDRLLDGDNLLAGRERLKSVLRQLTEE